MPGKLCRIFLRYRDAYVSMSYRWFNEYKLSFLFGVGAFFVEQLRWAHECARAHSI